MARRPVERTFLAGDIGGTKTNIGLFVPGKKGPRLRRLGTYASRDANGLESILEDFMGRSSCTPLGAAFGIAGPVLDGCCRATNLPWVVSESSIRKHFGWSNVRLLNDLVATAQAIPFLGEKKLCALNLARRRRRGNIGVVAPGTGLGQAMLVFHENRYVAVASEGGHVDFAPRSEEEVSLWRYLQGQFGHVSVERLLAGEGLVSIYHWLEESGPHQTPAGLQERMESGDPAEVISKSGLEEGIPLCRKALDHFVSILGAVCGNLALTATTTGGIYLGGGIPSKILPALKSELFLQAFKDKGRFQPFLGQIPVRVILDNRAALLGAAVAAQEMVDRNEDQGFSARSYRA